MRRLPLFIVLAVALSAQAQDYTKLSAHLSQLVRQQPSAAAARGPLPHPILTLMTTTDGLSATTFAADYGCQVVDSIGRIYIVSIPLSQVAPLSMDRRVERIEAERMKHLGGGIEGTIIFRTDSIDSLQGDTCRLSTTVSMGQVQLNITKSDYQDPRGNVYHVDGLMPHLGYLVLCGATVLLSGDGPA